MLSHALVKIHLSPTHVDVQMSTSQIYTWMPCRLFKCEKTFPTNLIFAKTKYYGLISVLDIVKVFMMVLKQC